jgi:fructose-specific PTS system IIA-like component
MLEVPSVAFILDELCTEGDFFSLGTNDLTQYFLAADRENAKVASLYSAFHPGFLRLLKHLVDGVRARGRWIGLCGELAEDPAALPLLVALRLDEISLAAPRIAGKKAALAELDASVCDALLERVLRCATRDEVEQTLRAPRVQARPMLTPDLVLGDVAAGTKEEVIREMIDALHVAGRTDRPESVEEAVWLREDTYSTGFGEGFALPHCKSDDLAASSIVIARLRGPVEWHSVDGQAVDTVILLAIRTGEHGNEHLKILARLSRLVMRDEFRALLRHEGDAARLADAIKARLASS